MRLTLVATAAALTLFVIASVWIGLHPHAPSAPLLSIASPSPPASATFSPTSAAPSPSVSSSPTSPLPTSSLSSIASPSPIAARLEAPSLLAPGNGTTVNDSSVTLQWSTVTGADHYIVEIQFCNHQAPCDDSNSSALGTYSAKQPTFTTRALKNYLDVNVRWRIAAVSASGATGPVSTWGQFEATLHS